LTPLNLGSLANAIKQENMSEKSTEKANSRKYEQENIDANIQSSFPTENQGNITNRRHSNTSNKENVKVMKK
jgi:hypothetical protein